MRTNIDIISSYVGGIAGYNNRGTVSDSGNNGEVSCDINGND